MLMSIIKFVVLAIIAAVVIGVLINITTNEYSSLYKYRKKILPVVAILAIGGATLMSSIVVVPAGSTGVKVTLGAVEEDGLESGLAFKTPFVSKVVMINNQVQRTDVDAPSSSKDLQAISSTISVNYKVLPSSSPAIYKNVGRNYEDVIIRPAIQEATKAITAKYTAEELITNRNTVSISMREALQEKIGDYGISVSELNIINFDFSPEFNKAIEAKQTAQQNALKAEQDLARIEVEAQQTVVKARAEAEAYEIKNAAITDQMIKMEFLNKWDGELPKVMSGDEGMMIDVTEIMN